MRDPRTDPAPGDVLSSDNGTSCLIVDDVSDGTVHYRIRWQTCVGGTADGLRFATLDRWREIAPLCVPRDRKLAEMQREYDEHAKRMAELLARMAFLRGAA